MSDTALYVAMIAGRAGTRAQRFNGPVDAEDYAELERMAQQYVEPGEAIEYIGEVLEKPEVVPEPPKIDTMAFDDQAEAEGLRDKLLVKGAIAWVRPQEARAHNDVWTQYVVYYIELTALRRWIEERSN